MDILKTITKYANTSHRYYVGNRSDRRVLYKYMSIDSFKKCIGFPFHKKNQSILFSEPSCWSDQFEKRFYLADYSNLKVATASDTPRVYACCFTYASNSDAAWKVYANKNLGLEGLCVKIKINRAKLSQELLKWSKGKYNLYEGFVNYKLTAYNIFHLHEKYRIVVPPYSSQVPNSHFTKIFTNNFKLENYLSLLLLKRSEFDYEKEFRYFLIDNPSIANKNQDRIYPQISWSNVIDEVDVDEQYPQSDFENLQIYLEEYLKIDKSLIIKTDINAMPGGLIKIEKP